MNNLVFLMTFFKYASLYEYIFQNEYYCQYIHGRGELGMIACEEIDQDIEYDAYEYSIGYAVG